MLLLALLAGCAQPPTAGVSHPKPFDIVQIRLMEDEFPKELSEKEGLVRHFGLKPGEYEEQKLRLDEMLDEAQATSVVVQVAASALAAKIIAQQKQLPGLDTDTDEERDESSPPDADRDSADATPAEANLGAVAGGAQPDADKLAGVLSEALNSKQVADSPFDRIDRVMSLYGAITAKTLRRAADARSINTPEVMKTMAKDPISRAKLEGLCGLVEDAPYREILLYQQVNVVPGSAWGRMVGARVQIVGVDSDPNRASEVQILRLFPDRAYDVQPTSFADSLQQALALTSVIDGSQGSVDLKGSLDKQATLRAETRRRFISRITKHGSYVDADAGIYGWNFYPSNAEVVQRSFFARMVGWLFGTPGKYEVSSRLEAGGRDAIVYLLVPAEATSLTLRSWSVDGGVDGGLVRERQPEGGEITVPIGPSGCPVPDAS